MSANSGIFTTEAVHSIRIALDESEDAGEFLSRVDMIAAEPGNTLEYPFEIGDPEQLSVVQGKRQATSDAYEAINAESVYEHLGALQRAQAQDPRLWTHLAFVQYRSYMEKRWPLVGDSLPSNLNWRNRARDRWLITSGSSGKLILHGVARLWWVAHLTYDPQKQLPLSQKQDDGFALTHVAFQREQRIVDIFERKAGQIPNLVIAILEHLESLGDEGVDAHVKSLLKEVRREYGIRELSVFSLEDTRTLLSRLGETLQQRGG